MWSSGNGSNGRSSSSNNSTRDIDRDDIRTTATIAAASVEMAVSAMLAPTVAPGAQAVWSGSPHQLCVSSKSSGVPMERECSFKGRKSSTLKIYLLHSPMGLGFYWDKGTIPVLLSSADFLACLKQCLWRKAPFLSQAHTFITGIRVEGLSQWGSVFSWSSLCTLIVPPH